MHTASKHQIDKSLVADSFKASWATYEEKAIVQKVISRQLVSFLGAICRNSFTNALEIGCCTGYMTEALCYKFGIKNIYVNDLVSEFCVQTCERLRKSDCSVDPIPFAGDIESLDLPNKLDLVVSSSTLQWMSDLGGLLERIRLALVSEGYLAFTIFGNGTMREISSITGRGLHYHSEEQLREMVAAIFDVELFTTDTSVLHFPSVRAILRHIQQTGVSGIGRNKWTKSSLTLFEQTYKQRYQDEKGLPLTYSSHYVIAKKKE